MRKQILSYLEKNSKMDSKEIAILLGTEPDVVENEIRKMEEEKIICGYDLMVILEGKTLKEVSQFVTDKLSTLDSVLSTATHFILKKYKDHGTIFDQKIKDERMLVTP